MTDRVVAVSGCNGFVGKHLVPLLAANGARVVGLGRETAASDAIAPTLSDYVTVDLATNWPHIDGVTSIVHLAGHSNVADSFAHPQTFINDNSAVVTNLGERLLALSSPPRALVISSDAVYDPDQPMPVDEHGRTLPTSPYAVSKLVMEMQAAYYGARGLPMIVARPFNHLGPGSAKASSCRISSPRHGAPQRRTRCWRWVTCPRCATTPTCGTWLKPTTRCSPQTSDLIGSSMSARARDAAVKRFSRWCCACWA